MEMKSIQEIIVVEGKNDTLRLKQFFNCDTIETGGKAMNAMTLQRIKEAHQKRGIIVFTDPDWPGQQIRRWISEAIPNCKHAFIDKEKARTDKKVGIEHASYEDLEQALSQCVTFTKDASTLSWQEFLSLNLIGDSKKRYDICETFHIGPCNAKTCFKRLNQMRVTLEQIKEYGYDTTNCHNS